MSQPSTRIHAAGEHAVLVEFDDPIELAIFTAHLRTETTPSILDVVPTEHTVMIFAAPGVTNAQLRKTVSDLLCNTARRDQVANVPGTEVRIGVRYDGADLADLAATTGRTPAAIIALHTSITWTCSFIGFAPGFGYLTSPDNPLDVPRRTQSRPQVPAGAVALAGKYSAIYPRSSPGGWQLIGTTDTPLWDLATTPPSLLSAGTRVRFTNLGVA